MGRLINTTSMTVDGLTDVGTWFVGEGDHDAASREHFASHAAALVGRPTWEGFLGYWPNETGPWADMFNPMPKFVASRTLTGPLEWSSTLIEGDAVEGVARLKEEMEGDIVLSGCGQLARTLIQAGLVDELCFWIHPAVGGEGTRPYEGAALSLRLIDSTQFDSGVTQLRYQPL